MSTMFSERCRERMLWLAVSWLLLGSELMKCPLCFQTGAERECCGWLWAGCWWDLLLPHASAPFPARMSAPRSVPTCWIHSFGTLKAPANTGFYPGKTSPVKVRAFSQKLFIIAPFFYFAGTSRVFSNSTGLHISCNKITHLELMLSKAHDFNQEQN